MKTLNGTLLALSLAFSATSAEAGLFSNLKNKASKHKKTIGIVVAVVGTALLAKVLINKTTTEKNLSAEAESARTNLLVEIKNIELSIKRTEQDLKDRMKAANDHRECTRRLKISITNELKETAEVKGIKNEIECREGVQRELDALQHESINQKRELQELLQAKRKELENFSS